MTTATAPGKIILAGEHAVVYGRPAIAVPVWERVATATITALPVGAGCLLVAPDIRRRIVLATAGNNPLAVVTRCRGHFFGKEIFRQPRRMMHRDRNYSNFEAFL